MSENGTRYMMEVMEAFSRGERIQTMPKDGTESWYETVDPSWNWHKCDYRVMPEENQYPVLMDGYKGMQVVMFLDKGRVITSHNMFELMAELPQNEVFIVTINKMEKVEKIMKDEK